MIELGKRQSLNIVKKTDFGVYLGKEDEKVLLPKKQVPADLDVGDALEVFVYRDSEDRLIATTNTPLITVGEMAHLEVKEVSKIGAFLDCGLEKDLLLPYKEQTCSVVKGKKYLVMMYVDKSCRLCATMRLYNYLSTDNDYKKDDKVEGTVYEISEGFGAFVAVDDKYHGMVPENELFGECGIGDVITARVTKVREDGKLSLSIREKTYIQIDTDATMIYDKIQSMGGSIPYTDKADPDIIKKEFNLSKNAFKRAVGRLLKEDKIAIGENSITIK